MAKGKGKAKRVEEDVKPAWQRFKEYLLSLKMEWQKVSFPSRKELTQSTVVVFLFTVLMMTVISAYDFLVGVVFDNIILPK